jgi:integrase/recombinase XerC
MAKQRRDGLYKRGRIWWVRKDPLEGKALSTGCTDFEAACRWRASRERDAADPSHAASQAAVLDEWIERFLAWKAQTKAPKTIEFYRQKLGHWSRRLGDGARLDALRAPSAFDAHVAERRADGASDRSIHKECAAMVVLLKLAKRKGVFAGDLDVLMPTDLDATYRAKKRALTREELIRLLSELEPRRAALVAVCVGLGCRLSEAMRLLPSDVSADRVFIGGTKTEGSRRWVPILSLYRPLIDAALPYLPLQPWGKLHRDLERACKRAGIEKVTPNDLRRSHATIARNAGLDMDTARRLLGHTTDALLKKTYDQPSIEELSERAEKALGTATPIQLRYSDGVSFDENSVGRQGFEPWTNGLKSRSLALLPKPAQADSCDDVELAGPRSDDAGPRSPTRTTITRQSLAAGESAGPARFRAKLTSPPAIDCSPAAGQEAGNFSARPGSAESLPSKPSWPGAAPFTDVVAAAWALRFIQACLGVCHV